MARQLGALALLAVLVAALGLHEHTALVAWLLLPGALLALASVRWRGLVPWLFSYDVGVAVLLLAALASPSLTDRRLSEHAMRAAAQVLFASPVEDKLADHPCARYQYRAGYPDRRGEPRDALGRAVYRVDGPDAPRVLVLGDSVMDFGFSEQLGAAFEAAGQPVEIVNAAMFGYAWEDDLCRLAEARAEGDWDLIVVGLCVNDLPLPATFDIDLGAGEHRYRWSTYVSTPLPLHPPAQVDSHHPAVALERAAWEARWGDRVVYDTTRMDLWEPFRDMLASDEGQLALLDTLVDTTRGVPTVFLPIPLQYTPQPDPMDVILDWQLDELTVRGATTLDLRPVIRSIGPWRVALGSRPEHLYYDILHLDPPGLDRAAEAVLDVWHGLGGPDPAPMHATFEPVPEADDGCGRARGRLVDAGAGRWEAVSACADPRDAR